MRIKLPGKNDWSTTPDEWEYEPELPWSKMGSVRRLLFVLMYAAVVIWGLLLLFLLAYQFRGL